MEKVILIKYGELTTKKGNRNFFIKNLYEMLKHKLKDYDVEIIKEMSRMEIIFTNDQLEEILPIIKHVFGIHKYHVAYKITTDLSVIKKQIINILDLVKFKTFKVEVKRSDKSFPMNSVELSKHLGGYILKNKPDIKVDVHNPDVIMHVEIKANNITYLYTNEYHGLGGYPVGSQPKALLMLSGGIDSPVSGYLAMKRGIKLEAVYFEALPHTSLQAREKVISLVKKLVTYTDKIILHIVPFTEIQEAIYKVAPHSYGITIMRRMMYRIMEQLANQRKAYAIVNGESIGQVASQTLTSMKVINEVTNLPIIRPVACLDKLEIIDIAKKIDTYDISILPYEDCCTIFVPKHPVINPNSEECLKIEQKYDFNNLIDDTLSKIKTITIKDQEEKQYEGLL